MLYMIMTLHRQGAESVTYEWVCLMIKPFRAGGGALHPASVVHRNTLHSLVQSVDALWDIVAVKFTVYIHIHSVTNNKL